MILNPYRYATGSSGPTPVAPEDVTSATMYAWHEADDITPQADNTRFAPWLDTSGAGRSLTQATSTLQPFYRTSGPNSLPYVEFNAAEILTGNTNIGTRSQPTTVFCVCRWDTSAGSVLHGGTSGNHMAIQSVANQLQMAATSNSIQYATTFPTGWILMTCYFNGSNSYMRVNATTVATGDPGSAVGDRIDMGAGSRTGTVGFNGAVAARVMFLGTLSLAELEGVEAHYMDKYAL